MLLVVMSKDNSSLILATYGWWLLEVTFFYVNLYIPVYVVFP